MAALGAMAAGPVPALAQDARKRQRTVVHVIDGEPHKWTRVLGFIRGLETSLEKGELAIAVVVQGLTTHMLKTDSTVASG